MYKNRSKDREQEDSPLVPIKTYIPKSLYKKMQMISEEREIPLSRLTAIAIFNELELGDDHSFNFEMKMPDEKFVEGDYAKEASRIMDVINQFRSGLGLDMLIMSKGMARIADTKDLLLGYRELKNADMVHEVHPSKVAGMKGHYHKKTIHVLSVTKFNKSETGKINRIQEAAKGPLDILKVGKN